jgi:hypothetical protein
LVRHELIVGAVTVISVLMNIEDTKVILGVTVDARKAAGGSREEGAAREGIVESCHEDLVFQFYLTQTPKTMALLRGISLREPVAHVGKIPRAFSVRGSLMFDGPSSIHGVRNIQ